MRFICFIVIFIMTWCSVMADDGHCTADTCARFEIVGVAAYDFGDIPQDGGPVECSFEFKSVGNAPLLILAGSTTCPCTQVAYSQDVLPPGDSLTMTVTYDPSLRPGQFRQAAVLKTNASPYQLIRVYVTGNVIAQHQS